LSYHEFVNFNINKYKLRILRAERVLFASDIPFGQMKTELAKVLSLPITDAGKELILSKNVKRLIGLD
jgi:predicted TIM-barrel fold metal-dependent hydrolase